jgi:hypothetical protein
VTNEMDAVRALRARGVNSPEVLLEFGTPDEILGACHRWDQQKGVSSGLLVKWIRDRNFVQEPKAVVSQAARNHALFQEYAARFPEGAVAETHATLIARRYPDELDDDVCAGNMIVFQALEPNLAIECEACGFVTGIPVRSLHVLGPVLALAPEPESTEPMAF